MLTMIVTGVTMALDKELAQPLATALAGPAEPSLWDQRAVTAVNHTEHTVSFDTALESARNAARNWGEAGDPVAIDLSTDRGLYQVRFADHNVPGASPRSIYVDSDSGAVAGQSPETGLVWTALDNRKVLHGGDLLGVFGRALVATTGLLLALMALTGLLMTLWRRSRKNPPTKRSP